MKCVKQTYQSEKKNPQKTQDKVCWEGSAAGTVLWLVAW